jgi:hypothetical protein
MMICSINKASVRLADQDWIIGRRGYEKEGKSVCERSKSKQIIGQVITNKH